MSTASSLHRRRKTRNSVMMTLSLVAAGIGLAWLALILGALLWKGLSGVNLAVFTEMTPPPGSAGGLLNAIAGSVVMTVIAVVVGTPKGAGSLPAIWQDDRAAVDIVVAHLASQGHKRIARVGGHAAYWHSVLRRDAFEASAVVAGLTAFSVEADYTAEHGAQATVSLLGSAQPPTAIVYDNDVMAAAGLAVAQRMGVSVPDGVTIISWDDSALCELMHPALTALRRDIAGAGSTAARMLRELSAGGHPESVMEATPVLQVRMSSGYAGVPEIPAVTRTRLTA